jgi:hypothetical protein
MELTKSAFVPDRDSARRKASWPSAGLMPSGSHVSSSEPFFCGERPNRFASTEATR